MNAFQSERRRQICARCGQLMFEFYRSPDGHFGVVNSPDRPAANDSRAGEIRCPTCDARYRLLDRLNAMGQPLARE